MHAIWEIFQNKSNEIEKVKDLEKLLMNTDQGVDKPKIPLLAAIGGIYFNTTDRYTKHYTGRILTKEGCKNIKYSGVYLALTDAYTSLFNKTTRFFNNVKII